MKKIRNYIVIAFVLTMSILFINYDNKKIYKVKLEDYKAYTSTTNVCGQTTTSKNDGSTYTVLFNSVGGKKIDLQVVAKDTIPTYISTSKDGYKFNGWYLGLEPYNFDFAINQDAILRAGFTKQCTITYKDETGKVINTETIDCGKTPAKYEPTKDGYEFGGWKDENGNIYDGGEVFLPHEFETTWKPIDNKPTIELETPVISETNRETKSNAVTENGQTWASSSTIGIDYKNSGVSSGISYYFKSTSPATSNADAYLCNDNQQECSTTATKTVEANKWYRTNNKSLSLVVRDNTTIYATVKYDKLEKSASFTVSKIDGGNVTTPILNCEDGRCTEWTKETRNYNISKNSTSKSGIQYYEYCLTTSNSNCTTEWVHANNGKISGTFVDNSKVTIALNNNEVFEGYVIARAVSKSGQISNASNAVTVKIDKAAPIISSVDIIGSGYEPVVIGSESEYYFKLRINASDNGSGIAAYYETIPETQWNNTLSNEEPILGHLTFDKNYTVTIRVVDHVGNEAYYTKELGKLNCYGDDCQSSGGGGKIIIIPPKL